MTQLVSLNFAAKRLGVSLQTLRRNMSDWGLVTVRLGRRVLIEEKELENLIERSKERIE